MAQPQSDIWSLPSDSASDPVPLHTHNGESSSLPSSAASVGSSASQPLSPQIRSPSPALSAIPVKLNCIDDQQFSTTVCEICCEIVPKSELRGCAPCTHRYCRACVAIFWHTAIFSGRHNHVPCACGGCTATATDDDIVEVVSQRTYARMLYFRSRDANINNPHVRWCPVEGCWQIITERPAPNTTFVDCPDCSARVCYKCGMGLVQNHACPPLRPTSQTAATIDSCTFHLWAFTHTKTCPTCHARIQRNKGCSHMTCSRCSAYFCWRCRGYLKCGTKLQGRPCVCDALLGTVVYSGMLVVGLVTAPFIIAGAVVGAAPFAIYRFAKKRRSRTLEPRNLLSTHTTDIAASAVASRADHVPEIDFLVDEPPSSLSNTTISLSAASNAENPSSRSNLTNNDIISIAHVDELTRNNSVSVTHASD